MEKFSPESTSLKNHRLLALRGLLACALLTTSCDDKPQENGQQNNSIVMEDTYGNEGYRLITTAENEYEENEPTATEESKEVVVESGHLKAEVIRLLEEKWIDSALLDRIIELPDEHIIEIIKNMQRIGGEGGNKDARLAHERIEKEVQKAELYFGFKKTADELDRMAKQNRGHSASRHSNSSDGNSPILTEYQHQRLTYIDRENAATNANIEKQMREYDSKHRE